jgi:riboflavin synthase
MVLTIRPSYDMTDCRVGDSVAIDGVCLTVTGMVDGAFTVDVSGETLSRSTLNTLGQGREVNLERALRLSDRLGGHLVSGHIDGVGQILKKEAREPSWFMRIGIDEHLSRYTIEKGSIAVDGVSLTINRCEKGVFEVNIIPQTGRETTIIKKGAGDTVNIEVDLIGKYVEKFLSGEQEGRPSEKKGGIDRGMLRQYGFEE